VTRAPYWPGWDIARGVALLPDGSGGYVLDGWGGLHPFALGDNPTPPRATSSRYWRGTDAARGIAISLDGQAGYVIDGYGALYPFSLSATAPPPPPDDAPRWSSPIARGVAITR
jgi:hypothetical protein